MNSTKIIGIILIVGGLLGLAFGGFSYTKQSTKAEIGPISFSVAEKESINIPLWASIAALVAGGAIIVLGSRKS